MIISVDEALLLPQFKGKDRADIKRRLDAIENIIRQYTHNNFQVRTIRFTASCAGKAILGYHPLLEVGDTIQISECEENAGLAVVTGTDKNNDVTWTDKDFLMSSHVLVTKVQYPADVVAGVLKMLQWDIESINRIGVKSETLSRHSVTYFEQDKNNQISGYPIALMGFLEPYKKARF